jgi:hypothetical protein
MVSLVAYNERRAFDLVQSTYDGLNVSDCDTRAPVVVVSASEDCRVLIDCLQCRNHLIDQLGSMDKDEYITVPLLDVTVRNVCK